MYLFYEIAGFMHLKIIEILKYIKSTRYKSLYNLRELLLSQLISKKVKLF